MTAAGLVPIDDSQRSAAKVAGVLYLVTIVTANFAEFYAFARLVVDTDPAATATNIEASERLFRVGVASDIFTFLAVIPLIVALYVVLRPVSRNIAVLALSWRLVETAIFVVSALAALDALRQLSNPYHQNSMSANELQALMMSAIGAHGAAYNIGLIFYGFGSAAFCYLFYVSRYIPRALAGLGVFASLLVGVCSFAFIVYPEAMAYLIPICYIPSFLFEVGAGLWLAIKGISQPS